MNYLFCVELLKRSNYNGLYYWKVYVKLCNCVNKQRVVKIWRKIIDMLCIYDKELELIRSWLIYSYVFLMMLYVQIGIY